VDGEGILYQNLGASEVFSVAETQNLGQNCGGSGRGYIHPYDVHVIGMLQGWNVNQSGHGFYCKAGNQVEDYSVVGNIGTYSACNNGTVRDEMKDSDCAGAVAPAAPFALSALYQPERKAYLVSWSDASNDAMQEVGFKVERRKGNTGNWAVIAWRPRNATGGISGTGNPNNWAYSATDRGGGAITEPLCANQQADLNTQTWEDYLVGSPAEYQYRVSAVGCNPLDTTGQSDIQVSNKTRFQRNASGSFLAFPVPSRDRLNLRLENKFRGKTSIRIFTSEGKEVWKGQAPKVDDVWNYSLQVGHLKPGSYRVLLSTDSFVEALPFTKE
jgi:hypothetical protein